MADSTLRRDFVTELFRVLLDGDRKQLELVIPHLRYQYLPTADHKKIWKTIVTFYNNHRRVPTVGLLKQELYSDKQALKILDDVDLDVEQLDSQIFIEKLEAFIKQTQFVELHAELAELWNKNEKNKALETLTAKATEIQAFSIQRGQFEQLFSEYAVRHTQRFRDAQKQYRKRIPTGIFQFDTHIHGGIETGEIALWLGESGKGKTALLYHLAIHAARLGHHVVHFQLEGTREQMVNRFDAAWTGMAYVDVKMGAVDTHNFQKSMEVVEKMTGEVHLRAFEKFGSRTMIEIRNEIRALKAKYPIAVVTLDYLTLAEPGDLPKGYNRDQFGERNRRLRLCEMFKDLCVEENLVGHTVAQAHDIAPELRKREDFVMTRHNIGESKNMVQPFDYFLTINSTDAEYELGQRRIYADKIRDYPGEQLYHIVTDLESMRFYNHSATIRLLEGAVEEEEE